MSLSKVNKSVSKVGSRPRHDLPAPSSCDEMLANRRFRGEPALDEELEFFPGGWSKLLDCGGGGVEGGGVEGAAERVICGGGCKEDVDATGVSDGDGRESVPTSPSSGGELIRFFYAHCSASFVLCFCLASSKPFTPPKKSRSTSTNAAVLSETPYFAFLLCHLLPSSLHQHF